mgnify:FL=1
MMIGVVFMPHASVVHTIIPDAHVPISILLLIVYMNAE